MKNYKIEINQTHGFMCNRPYFNVYQLTDITGFEVPLNQFTQIGSTGEREVMCLNLRFKPSGLTIPVFITGIHTQEKTMLGHLQRFLENNDPNIVMTFQLGKLPGSCQKITITREEI